MEPRLSKPDLARMTIYVYLYIYIHMCVYKSMYMSTCAYITACIYVSTSCSIYIMRMSQAGKNSPNTTSVI